MNKSIKIVKKYAKLRYDDPKFIDIAIKLYEDYDSLKKEALILEMKEYIDAVANKSIIPTIPKIPIKVFKK